MQCATIKKGVNCSFMKKKGCSFNEGHCQQIVEPCQGCSRVSTYEDGDFCNVVPSPSTKWRVGPCSFATHVDRKREEVAQKINPLKASKRAAASRK